MSPLPRKIYAASAEEREKICDHPGGFPHAGAIPCTGPRICRMCGTDEREFDQTAEGQVIILTRHRDYLLNRNRTLERDIRRLLEKAK